MPTILVIREAEEFSRTLSENGFKIINLPLIETKLLGDASDFDAKFGAINDYDGVFLTSRHAANVFRRNLRETKKIYRGAVYVLGKRSFDVLKTENLDLYFDESANTALEMLSKIAPEKLANKRFLFVRGDQSLRTVPDFLKRCAAVVDETIVYETRSVAIENEKINRLSEKLKNGEIVAACFFSPSQGESFLEQFGAEILHQTRIATIGRTTAEFFERRGLPVDFVSTKATAKDFAAELTVYLNKALKRAFANEADGTVIVGEQKIDGFIDDERTCPNCSENRIYYDDYDSFFCPQCNVWLDSACSDQTCEFCRSRPEKPLN